MNKKQSDKWWIRQRVKQMMNQTKSEASDELKKPSKTGDKSNRVQEAESQAQNSYKQWVN